MKKPTILIALILSIGMKVNGQELTCKDFKIGTFFIPDSEEKKFTIVENDSIKEYAITRNNFDRFVVIREKNTQTEWKNGIGKGTPLHAILEWIDECTYRLTYDSSKMEMNEVTNWVNENKGIVVSKRKIEGKCLFYDATMTTNSGELISQNGVICME